MSAPKDYGQAEGYRLLDPDEIGDAFDGAGIKELELWIQTGTECGCWVDFCSGSDREGQYRTKLSRADLAARRRPLPEASKRDELVPDALRRSDPELAAALERWRDRGPKPNDLRFAAALAAVQGFCANIGMEINSERAVAKAYEVADAMLAQGARQSGVLVSPLGGSPAALRAYRHWQDITGSEHPEGTR